MLDITAVPMLLVSVLVALPAITALRLSSDDLDLIRDSKIGQHLMKVYNCTTIIEDTLCVRETVVADAAGLLDGLSMRSFMLHAGILVLVWWSMQLLTFVASCGGRKRTAVADALSASSDEGVVARVQTTTTTCMIEEADDDVEGDGDALAQAVMRSFPVCDQSYVLPPSSSSLSSSEGLTSWSRDKQYGRTQSSSNDDAVTIARLQNELHACQERCASLRAESAQLKRWQTRTREGELFVSRVSVGVFLLVGALFSLGLWNASTRTYTAIEAWAIGGFFTELARDGYTLRFFVGQAVALIFVMRNDFRKVLYSLPWCGSKFLWHSEGRNVVELKSTFERFVDRD